MSAMPPAAVEKLEWLIDAHRTAVVSPRSTVVHLFKPDRSGVLCNHSKGRIQPNKNRPYGPWSEASIADLATMDICGACRRRHESRVNQENR